MFQRSRTAMGDHGDVHRLDDLLQEFNLESYAGSFVVDRGNHQFAGPELHSPYGPLFCVETCRLAAVVSEYSPAPIGLLECFNRDDDALTAIGFGRGRDETGRMHGGRIDANFVCTG